VRWIIVAGAVACASGTPADSGADAPAGPTCAELPTDAAPCEALGVAVSARFVDPAGAPVAGEWARTAPLRLEGRVTNGGAAGYTVRSPDCVLKEWWLYAENINVNGNADCFGPTELPLGAGETGGVPSPDLDVSALAPGPLRGTVTLWMLDATDTLQVCSVCAEGVSLTE
jgi:hypothetical protein